MTNSIATVNVSQQQPPSPSTLQRTGAMISQGGTTKAVNSLTLITQLADLVAILAAAKAITSMVLSGGTVTVTTTSAHGWTDGDIIPVVITGVTPTAYNGPVTATVTGASTFTYPLSGSPGSVTVQGTVVLGDEAELLNMGTEFYTQGSGLSVYVLELGEGTATEGVGVLSTWITNNPGRVYSYLVPEEWDGNAAFLVFLGLFNNTTARTYFFVYTTTETYTDYTALMKCAFTMVAAPAAPTTEFDPAAPFWVTLNYNPGSTNKVTPLSFSYLYGVTPYPLSGNGTLLAELKAANVNYVDTGAEGGISTAILKWGNLQDGNSFNYWYSIDWLSINAELVLANAVINGSNNPLAPLDYNQQGINTLQDVLTQLVTNGVSYGLAVGTVKQTQLPADQFEANFNAGLYLGQLVVNAEPFLTYTAENPSDFAAGKYAGLAVTWTPGRGFTQVVVNITATNII